MAHGKNRHKQGGGYMVNNQLPIGSQIGQPGQKQIQVDLRNATPVACHCGSTFFQQAVLVFKVSALVSPTGQELIANQPVLVCLNCKTPLGVDPKKDEISDGYDQEA